jgi:hypothetical protein
MEKLLRARARKKVCYAVAFLATIVAGLASRQFPQLLPAFLGKYPGDALWALMIFLGAGLLFNKASTLKVGCAALGFCFAIEALKLCQTPWLINLRHTTLGHLVFGHAFSWQNLVAYTVGVLVGMVGELTGAD